jgi:hypothetical protein
MQRFHKGLLIVSAVLLAWLLMQAVHELGHVIAAWLTGGHIERVVLHPLAISRTDVEPNPHPLIVAWGGPLFGSLAPLALWGLAATFRLPITFLARFFVGFCLLTNGLYLGIGSFQGIGDAGDIVRYGSPIWTLWLFGIIAAPAGLALWNGLGPSFGLGKNARDVSRRVAYGCALGLIALVAIEFLLAQP